KSFFPVSAFAFVDRLGNALGDVAEQRRPCGALGFPPIVLAETAVQAAMRGPRPNQLPRAFIFLGFHRHGKLVQGFAAAEHQRSITLGTLKNVPSDSGAFASAASCGSDLRNPSCMSSRLA